MTLISSRRADSFCLPLYICLPPSALCTLSLKKSQEKTPSVHQPHPSSFEHETNRGMELDKLNGKVKQEPHLSGAYIRSLVKHLTTSRSQDSMNPDNPHLVVDADLSPPPNSSKQGKVLDAPQSQKSAHRQPHKRQVRRRLHTRRPYQERLLNMAEARREIVTALKFHRASMKQASEQRQQQQQEAKQLQRRPTVPFPPLQHPNFEQDGRIKSKRNPRIYPSCTNNFFDHMDGSSDSSFSHPPPSVPNPLSWPTASPVSPPLMAENLSYNLPNRTLGLNLNFQDFNNLDASLYLNNNKSASFHSYSSPSSSSPSLSMSTDQEVHSVAISQGEGTSALVDATYSIAATQVTRGEHMAMDDKGMAEIRSLGERHQAEWNDTMNLVTSARWFKFLKNMEHQATEAKTEDDVAYPIFDEPMEFPDWLNANERCFEQFSEEYVLDPTLPGMDIGDIEGIDEEWLA